MHPIFLIHTHNQSKETGVGKGALVFSWEPRSSHPSYSYDQVAIHCENLSWKFKHDHACKLNKIYLKLYQWCNIMPQCDLVLKEEESKNSKSQSNESLEAPTQ
ncbi:hypothetical protein AAHE18_05G130400 [Arachis hypogaea]